MSCSTAVAVSLAWLVADLPDWLDPAADCWFAPRLFEEVLVPDGPLPKLLLVEEDAGAETLATGAW